jgi:hypothetical protein
MGPQRFRAVIAAGPGGRAIIAVPFDPDEAWGAKADHPVGGTIGGRFVRGRMRKVYAGLFSSIGGVVEAPSEWQPGFDEEMGAAWSRMLEGQDAVLMGRVTFTEFAGYWPTSDDEPFAS